LQRTHNKHDHDHDHDDQGDCHPVADQHSVNRYQKHGVQFQFPSDWVLTEQSTDDETTISLQSDGTSFWTLMLFNSRPDPEDVVDTVVSAIEQDYEDVDVSSSMDDLGGFPSLVRELDFVCYDLVNSATVRAFQTSQQTVMVLYQGTDHELAVTRDQLVAVTRSLQIEDEDETQNGFDEE
jgi:hypothetical protein